MPRIPISVRAILFDQRGNLLLVKRTRPDVPVYWVAPGGGVEEDDDSLQSALRRELREELGAEVKIEHLTLKLEDEHGVKSLFYVCRLREMNLTNRGGPEFSNPENGQYEPEWIPFQTEHLESLNIVPEAFKDFLFEHAGTRL